MKNLIFLQISKQQLAQEIYNKMDNKNIRVRFAPSPTGPLHIGNTRTALFNWLFAKNYGGKFILRIEDTDKERSKPEFEKDIINGLKWLELDYNEGPDIDGDYGPYRQSERTNIYENYLNKLFDENKAYYCFCTKEELEADRQAMMSQGIAPKYSGKCRNLPKEECENKIKKGDKGIIRFKVPNRDVEFDDLIRGKIKFDANLFGDIVIAKNLKEPLYNFVVVIDDYEMKISHIIRGEDHLSNTPKQVLIQEAFGFNIPKYVHLPLILTTERKKLSKRYIDVSLKDYKNEGYLPEAMLNFIAFLGWHPEEDREILSREELIKEFDIKRIQKSGAAFNIDKLDWLNSQYIKKINIDKVAEKIGDFIPDGWNKNKNLLTGAINLEKERIKKLTDFKELADFFFELPEYNFEILIWKNIDNEKIKNNLKMLFDEINKIQNNEFNKENFEKNIMPFTKTFGVGELLWPLRVALSGKKASPGPFEIMEVIGKTESLKRIDIAVKKL